MDTFSDKFFAFTIGAVLTFVVHGFMGCGSVELAATRDGGAADLAKAPEPDDETALAGGGGMPPIGYNQRQCQWDACGGPLPNVGPLVDPIPEVR